MINDKLGLIEKITTEIKDKMDIAVVGLSGGVDSMIVATLCKLALGEDNVFAVHMPHNAVDTTTEGKFNWNSKRIAAKLEIKSMTANIGATVLNINREIYNAIGAELNKVNEGNTRSRARMVMLYGIAHELGNKTKRRARVLGTGNLSEDFIGYDTKGGDALADIFPIGELYKSEVYELADFFVSEGLIEEGMIDRNPSAGLWDGQSDADELGYTYDEMEPSIRKILNKDLREEDWSEVDEFVFRRHIANEHKHLAPPVIELRSTEFLK